LLAISLFNSDKAKRKERAQHGRLHKAQSASLLRALLKINVVGILGLRVFTYFHSLQEAIPVVTLVLSKLQ
jgi:hypothetical protein